MMTMLFHWRHFSSALMVSIRTRAHRQKPAEDWELRLRVGIHVGDALRGVKMVLPNRCRQRLSTDSDAAYAFAGVYRVATASLASTDTAGVDYERTVAPIGK